jgi:putative sigma-54 modulation protein
MRLELTGRHVTITPNIRKLVDEQLKRVLRMLNDSAVSGQIVLTKEKSRVHCDATIHARGEKFLHGEANGRDVEAALAGAVDKIDRQAQRIKGKWTERKRRGGATPRKMVPVSPPSDDGASSQVRIIRARRYAVKPMTIDEAAMEIGNDANAFLVFRNAVNEEITVLFRRADGNLGLIEPEA